MREDDARKLDHATLEAIRIRAVRSVQAGENPGVVAQSREETARTEDDVNIFSRIALEGLAIALSGKIQRGLVAVFSDRLPSFAV